MTALRLAWLLGKPTKERRGPLVLTAGAYLLVCALVLIVLSGALSFTRVQNDLTGAYRILAALAVVLLIVPLTAVGMAAARLSVRSQDTRLSTVRLLGGTPGLVTAMTVVESTATALIGAVGGVALYALLAPLVGLVHFQGSAIGTAMWLPPATIGLVLLGVLVVAAGSSAVGLRRVMVSPLGVRNRVVTPKPRWIRAAVMVGLIAVIYAAFNALAVLQSLALIVAVLLAGFALALGGINLVGPWAVALIAKRKLRGAQRPEHLLAARMILENPAQAWRQVSGLAMTSFVAVVGGSGAALMATTAAEGPAESPDALFATDIMTGVLVTLAVSFVSVACSTAITQAAATLDRRTLYEGLERLGMQRKTLEKARVGSVMGPVVGVGMGAAVISAVLLFPLVGAAIVIAPVSVAIIVATLLTGLLTVRGSVALTKVDRMLKPIPH